MRPRAARSTWPLSRSPAARQAVDLASSGLTPRATADRLGVSRQAIRQRLVTAGWALEQRGRATAARLLDAAHRAADDPLAARPVARCGSSPRFSSRWRR